MIRINSQPLHPTEFGLRPTAKHRFPPLRAAGPDGSDNQTIAIERGKVLIHLSVQNILFVKAEHVYCRLFFTNDQRVLQRTSLENLQRRLPRECFIRVHRSFIVNVNHIRKFNSTKILIGETVIPIGRTWKDKVVARLKGYEK